MSIIDSDDESEEDIKNYFKKSTSSKKSKASHQSKDKKKKIKKDKKDKKSKKSKKDKSEKYGSDNWCCFVNRNGWIFYLRLRKKCYKNHSQLRSFKFISLTKSSSMQTKNHSIIFWHRFSFSEVSIEIAWMNTKWFILKFSLNIKRWAKNDPLPQ